MQKMAENQCEKNEESNTDCPRSLPKVFRGSDQMPNEMRKLIGEPSEGLNAR